MDNQTQNPTQQQTPPVAQSQQQGQQPVPQPQQMQTVQQVPVQQQPISVGRAKEMPAMPSNEWVAPSTPEVVLPQEVKEAGVEAKPVVPSIPQAVQQAGVMHAKETTPVPAVTEVPLNMKAPRSVLEHLKQTHKKVTEGFSWLVRLIIKEQDKKEKGASL